MNNKFKKSKYAAIILASTMALSTVASVTPQAFGGETIEAQAKTTEALKTFQDKVKSLNYSDSTYGQDVLQARSFYDGLTEADDKKAAAKLEATLKAHEAVSGATELNTYASEIKAIDLDTLKAIEEVTGDVDTDKKNKDNTVIKRGTNTNVEANAASLENFKKEYDKLIAKDKNTKKILASIYKTYTTNLKAVTAQQKTIDAIYYAKPVVNILSHMATPVEGTAITLNPVSLKISKNKFKIDGDQYTAEVKDGKITIFDPHGEKVNETATAEVNFTVINSDTGNELGEVTNDTDGDKVVNVTPGATGTVADSTLYDGYKAYLVQGALHIDKTDGGDTKKITLTKAVSDLDLNTKIDVETYKTYTAGTTKYSDEQIEAIQALSDAYKKLSGPAKKALTADQTAAIKKYQSNLKAQQALEKKLASVNSKGVTQLISKLKYTNDLDKYEESILEAEKAYKKLSAKYQKKVKPATVKSLNSHKKALKIMRKIKKLDTTELLKGEATTTLEGAIDAIDGKDGIYTAAVKEDKKVKSLVKNYKDLTALKKLIASNKDYIKVKDDLDTFEGTLSQVTGTQTVRIVNNQVLLNNKVFNVTTDKSSKVITIENVTGTGESAVTTKFEVPLDTTVNGTGTGYTDYKFTNAKGKLSVSKAVTPANDETPSEVFDFKNVTTDVFKELAEDKKYSDKQKEAIQAAIDAQATINKKSAAKKFINKEDTTALKAYQTALKQQQALETKIDKEELDALSKQVAALKFSTEKESDGTSTYEKETAKAVDAYDVYVGTKSWKEDGTAEAIADATADTTKVEKAKAIKTKLDDHVKAAAFTTLLVAIDPITNANKTDEDLIAAVQAARGTLKANSTTEYASGYNSLTANQKKLVVEGEKILKEAEKATTPSALPDPTKTTVTVSGTTLKILFDKEVKVAVALDDAAFIGAVPEVKDDDDVVTTQARDAIKVSASTTSKASRTVEVKLSGALYSGANGNFTIKVAAPETATSYEVEKEYKITLATAGTYTITEATASASNE